MIFNLMPLQMYQNLLMPPDDRKKTEFFHFRNVGNVVLIVIIIDLRDVAL